MMRRADDEMRRDGIKRIPGHLLIQSICLSTTKDQILLYIQADQL